MATEANEAPYLKEKRARVETPNAIDGVHAKPGCVGTAMALAQALEESGDTIYGIRHEPGMGQPIFRVHMQYGHSGGEGTVPEGVDRKLREWGYEPVERAPDPTEEAAKTHTYRKYR